MASDEAKIAKRFVDDLQGTRQTQIFLETALIARSIGKKPKECLILATNLRLALIKKKKRLSQAAVKKSFSMLDVDSMEFEKDPSMIKIGFRTTKQVEVWSIQFENPTILQQFSNSVYSSLRAFDRARGPLQTTGVQLPPVSANAQSYSISDSVGALYLAICDRYELRPIYAFYDSIKNNDTRELNVVNYFLSDSSTLAKMTSADLQAISECLRNQDIFERIVLPDNLTLPEDALSCIVAIAFSPNNIVHSLICHGNNWTKSAIKIIGNTMKSAVTVPRLKTLIIKNQILGDEGFELLIEAISSSKAPIEYLAVSNCSVSSKGASLMAESQQLVSALVSLDLSRNELSKSFTGSLSDFIKRCKALRRLSLSMTNVIVDDIMTSLAENKAISMDTMEMLNLSGLKINKECTLVLRSIIGQTRSLSHLIIERTKISDFLLAGILDGISNNSNPLQFVLSLSYCNIGASFTKIVVDSVKRHGSIDNVVAMGIQYNNLGDGFQELCQALEKFSNLKHLALDGNIEVPKLLNHSKKSKQIGDALAKLIQSLTRLECISLAADDKHAMGDGVISILEAAIVHPSLKQIDISSNRLSEKGFTAIIELISQSKTLVRIDMDGNPIPSSCLLELAAAIRSNNESALRYLNVDRTLRELMVERRSTRRLSSIAALAQALLDRLEANQSNRPIPPSSQDRFAIIRRLESLFGDASESFDLIDQLTHIAQTYPAESMAAIPSSSVSRRMNKSISIAHDSMADITERDSAFDSAVPQFGVPLTSMDLILSEDIARWYPAGIPSVLVQMDIYLDSRNATSSIGIFRLAPDEADSKAVKKQLNDGTFRECQDINSVANNMKVWFRDMPVKLLHGIPVSDLNQFVSVEHTDALIARITEPYRSLFLWTLDLFAKYASHSEESKMTPHNLAIVFSPNFIATDTNSTDPMADMRAFQLVCKIIENAIVYRSQVFDSKSLKSVQKEWQLRFSPAELKSQIDDDEATSSESLSSIRQGTTSGSSPASLKPTVSEANATFSREIGPSTIKPSSSDMNANALAMVMTGGHLKKPETSRRKESTLTKFKSAEPQDAEEASNPTKPGSGYFVAAGIQKSLMQEMQEAHKRKAATASQAATTT